MLGHTKLLVYLLVMMENILEENGMESLQGYVGQLSEVQLGSFIYLELSSYQGSARYSPEMTFLYE